MSRIPGQYRAAYSWDFTVYYYITILYSQMNITSINFSGDIDISVSSTPISVPPRSTSMVWNSRSVWERRNDKIYSRLTTIQFCTHYTVHTVVSVNSILVSSFFDSLQHRSLQHFNNGIAIPMCSQRILTTRHFNAFPLEMTPSLLLTNSYIYNTHAGLHKYLAYLTITSHAWNQA